MRRLEPLWTGKHNTPSFLHWGRYWLPNQTVFSDGFLMLWREVINKSLQKERKEGKSPWAIPAPSKRPVKNGPGRGLEAVQPLSSGLGEWCMVIQHINRGRQRNVNNWVNENCILPLISCFNPLWLIYNWNPAKQNNHFNTIERRCKLCCRRSLSSPNPCPHSNPPLYCSKCVPIKE